MRHFILATTALVALGAPSAFAFPIYPIAIVHATGNDNDLTHIYQNGSGKNALGAFVNGNDNTVKIKQNASSYGYFPFKQSGVNNSLTVIDGSDNTATVNQKSQGYGFSIYGYKIGIGHTTNNSATLQIGYGNTVHTSQDAVGPWATNNSGVVQAGAFNYANVKQVGSNNSLVLQGGVLNGAKVTQYGANSAFVAQGGAFQYSDIKQAGFGNSDSSVQLGAFQYNKSVQIGNGNSDSTTQVGAFNSAQTYQQGNGGSISVTQVGALNDASVSQHGTGYAIVSTVGNGNTVTIHQSSF